MTITIIFFFFNFYFLYFLLLLVMLSQWLASSLNRKFIHEPSMAPLSMSEKLLAYTVLLRPTPQNSTAPASAVSRTVLRNIYVWV